MAAFNFAVSQSNTELFMCIDSDDFLSDTAIEIILDYWDNNALSIHGGLIGLSAYQKSKDIIGTKLPVDVKESTVYDLYYKKGIKGDKTFIFRLDILRQFPFPIIQGEKHIPLSIVYFQIDMHYKFLLLNEILSYCGYLPDGYSSKIKQVAISNPKGRAYYFKYLLKIAHNLPLKYKMASNYVFFSVLSGNANFIVESPCRLITIMAIPGAFLLYFIKYRRIIKQLK